MKGRYAGCHMTTYGHILPGAVRLVRWSARTGNLTKKAKQRLKVLDWLRNHKGNISLAARHFAINRETVRIWQQRFKWKGLTGLNDLSHRPKTLRQPTTSWEVTLETVKLKKQFPSWSKYKVEALLKVKGINISPSTIGRVFKRFNLINEKVSKKRRKSALNPKRRFPRGFKIANPGDMVQMDTKHITALGGEKMYQFTAIDVLTKRRVLRIMRSNSSRNGKKFLNECLKYFPFPIKTVQTDNGPEFMGEFDKYLKKLNIAHYYTYPRHPKQNSYVENSHSSDEREFYGQGNTSSLLDVMQEKIITWQNIWNNVRPNQALNYLTPNQYFIKWQQGRLPTKDTIILQT